MRRAFANLVHTPPNDWEGERRSLLDRRISELGLSIQGSLVEKYVDRLYAELDARGLRFHPPVYLSDEWGCPDGTPLIGIPFYLADHRLSRIEEELAVPKDAVSETVCLGLARDGHSLKPEVLMRTRLAIRADKIPALNGIEHSALLVIPGDPVSLNDWLTAHWEQIAPASLACLVAHVACTFATGLAATWQR